MSWRVPDDAQTLQVEIAVIEPRDRMRPKQLRIGQPQLYLSQAFEVSQVSGRQAGEQLC
jgi:hypothetical protein